MESFNIVSVSITGQDKMITISNEDLKVIEIKFEFDNNTGKGWLLMPMQLYSILSNHILTPS